MPAPQTQSSDAERFWSKVAKTDGCWLWTAAVNRDGYVSFGAGYRTFRAHRFAYELHYGPIPDGLQVDHVCHNEDTTCAGGNTCLHRRCMNPAHLEAVTGRENTFRAATTAAVNAAKTHCKNGHEFTPENTIRIKPSRTQRNGARGCRACRSAARVRHAARRQSAA